MAEWLKAHAWKACKRETVSRVRIPLSPPFFKSLAQLIIYNRIVWASYGRQHMKNIFTIIVLSCLLYSCATAPSKDVQKSMIDQGAIKIGMNADTLIYALGGYSAVYLFHPIQKELTFISPITSQRNFGSTYYYLAERFAGSNYDMRNYKITKMNLDPIKLYDYVLPKMPEGKNKILWQKWRAQILSNPNYISWKKNPNKTNNRVASKSRSSKSQSSSASNKGGSSGSAFFVTNKGHIITNYHVIQNCRSIPKIKYKDRDVEAKVIAKDSALDLALLKAELRNTKYVSLSGDQPKKLQRIIASGYPFGKYISDDLKFTSGIVSSLKGPGDDTTLVQVDAALNPGNSGGPIVDEESGKLVAVSVMGMKKSISEGQNFGIKTSSVKNFLQTNKVKVPTSWFGTSDVAKLLEDTTLYTFCR